jgi:hypothetical protein
MPDIARVKLKWTGFPGGPGLSVFHFKTDSGAAPDATDSLAVATRTRAFAEAIKGMIPANTTLTVDPSVEIIDTATGTLQTVYSVTPPAATVSTASGTITYSAASGAVVTWRTGGIRNGRRVRGRTFLVPIHGNSYQNDGSLDAGYITSINTAATNLRDIGSNIDLCVYGRESAPGAADGVAHVVTSHSVPDMAAVLRSRRN